MNANGAVKSIMGANDMAFMLASMRKSDPAIFDAFANEFASDAMEWKLIHSMMKRKRKRKRMQMMQLQLQFTIEFTIEFVKANNYAIDNIDLSQA